jgi:hypothetical protein
MHTQLTTALHCTALKCPFQVPSIKTKVARMKRKADTIVGPTVPKKVHKLTKD